LSPCSAEHLRLVDVRDQDRRRRKEAEANRFAALLLMPPPVLRAELQQIYRPEISDVVRLATTFDVSKEALARAYTEYSREAVAIVVIRNGRILRIYRNVRNFPWIDVSPGQSVPDGSSFHSEPCSPRHISETVECEPSLWLGEADARKVETLTEQILGQQNGLRSSCFMRRWSMRKPTIQSLLACSGDDRWVADGGVPIRCSGELNSQKSRYEFPVPRVGNLPS